jgi:hypothetical protein
LKIALSLLEARVLGCLIEKELSTPDYYPLSLNALTNACNQKSNRHPVLELEESVVQDTLDALIKKRLVVPKSSSGSRVSKFAHRLSNPITNTMDFSAQELAVLCELLVRGPQTVGELRTHAGRLTEFADVAQVESTLLKLRTRDEGPFVAELPRQPGRRDVRHAQLFTELPVDAPAASYGSELLTVTESSTDRVTALEQEVVALRAEVAEVRAQLDQLASKLEGSP